MTYICNEDIKELIVVVIEQHLCQTLFMCIISISPFYRLKKKDSENLDNFLKVMILVSFRTEAQT